MPFALQQEKQAQGVGKEEEGKNATSILYPSQRLLQTTTRYSHSPCIGNNDCMSTLKPTPETGSFSTDASPRVEGSQSSVPVDLTWSQVDLNLTPFCCGQTSQMGSCLTAHPHGQVSLPSSQGGRAAGNQSQKDLSDPPRTSQALAAPLRAFLVLCSTRLVSTTSLRAWHTAQPGGPYLGEPCPDTIALNSSLLLTQHHLKSASFTPGSLPFDDAGISINLLFFIINT